MPSGSVDQQSPFHAPLGDGHATGIWQRRVLRDEVYAISGLVAHPRMDMRSAQWIDAVDMTQANHHCCVGDPIISGTMDVEVGWPRLILVASMVGPRKHPSTSYRVVRMETDGTLMATDIAANDAVPGWAISLREQVAAALHDLVGQA